MTIHEKMEWIRNAGSNDVSLLLTSLAGAGAWFVDNALTAIPLILTLIFQLYWRWRKNVQLEKHREELHKKVLYLLGEGKPVPDTLLNSQKEEENE